MKYIHSLITTLLLVASANLLQAEEPKAYQEYARLLDTYVTPTGVKYKEWHKNKEDVKALDAVLKAFSKTDLEALNRSEQKAFYINLYNAGMLQAVLDHYPIKTVTTIVPDFGIFKKKYIKLNGKKLSLDGIEKGTLLKHYHDPRIHFVVNCASRSCPPLADYPYRGESLEEQLDKQTRIFAESTEAVQIDKKNKTLKFTQLLQWYAKDFKPHSPEAYFNQYRSEKLPRKYKTDWINYNWSLNTAQ